MKYISPKQCGTKENFQLTHNVGLDIRNFFKFISLYLNIDIMFQHLLRRLQFPQAGH